MKREQRRVERDVGVVGEETCTFLQKLLKCKYMLQMPTKVKGCDFVSLREMN